MLVPSEKRVFIAGEILVEAIAVSKLPRLAYGSSAAGWVSVLIR